MADLRKQEKEALKPAPPNPFRGDVLRGLFSFVLVLAIHWVLYRVIHVENYPAYAGAVRMGSIALLGTVSMTITQSLLNFIHYHRYVRRRHLSSLSREDFLNEMAIISSQVYHQNRR